MTEQRRGSHTVSRLTVHLVWVTQHRHPVLPGEIRKRCRELIIQIGDAEDVKILKGAVSKDHVHMPIEYAPSASVSDLVKRFKERSTRPNPFRVLPLCPGWPPGFRFFSKVSGSSGGLFSERLCRSRDGGFDEPQLSLVAFILSRSTSSTNC